ncbi:hypothetical protein [Nonomuraea basaltis]|uniref:hypothetical protein n=1 Tax=Nonomuraea basaltis TaxID=2495887 RepID=UPI00110C5530|nr:hypothetical protein [Nonomuraea basaltis]TMR92407.1 hypothetical protein EJK15_44785 [Nonomuraea basaltis]
MPSSSKEQRERRQPAYIGLIALIAEMRPDWDIDQITAELLGCPWSEQLILAAVRATRPDDEDKLRVADEIIKVASQRVPVTQAQLDAYTDYASRRLNRAETK